DTLPTQFTVMAREPIRLMVVLCPQCGKPIVTIEAGKMAGMPGPSFVPQKEFMAWPLHIGRPVPPEVPTHIAEDYQQAAIVLQLSPKASAALSRRCLQVLLREQGYNQHDLWEQIEK